MGERAILPHLSLILDTTNPLTFYWLIVTTFFETGLGLSTYVVYVKLIPYLKQHAKLMEVPQGYNVNNRLARVFTGPTAYKLPNRWWIRLLAFQGTVFVIVFTVFVKLFLSVGWVSPLSSQGFVFDMIFARSNGQPNGAHLMSYIGIPIIGLYSMWKFRGTWKDISMPDLSMGLLIGAFLVAIHEGIWEPVYYVAYSQFLSWDVLTNVLKDISFASMLILFLLAFWKYPYRTIPMKAFAYPVILYLYFVAEWFFFPYLLTSGYYPLFPITTINNYVYGKGIYSETAFWNDPFINGIEVASWFGLFLMMQYVLIRWKAK